MTRQELIEYTLDGMAVYILQDDNIFEVWSADSKIEDVAWLLRDSYRDALNSDSDDKDVIAMCDLIDKGLLPEESIIKMLVDLVYHEYKTQYHMGVDVEDMPKHMIDLLKQHKLI